MFIDDNGHPVSRTTSKHHNGDRFVVIASILAYGVVAYLMYTGQI